MAEERADARRVSFGRREDSVLVPKSEERASSTPYAAPELAQGNLPDRLSDVWTLGVLASYCIDGKPPFTHGPAPRGDDVGPRLRLLAALEPCFSEVRAHRPENARAVARSLFVAAHAANVAPPFNPDPEGLPDYDHWVVAAVKEGDTIPLLERPSPVPLRAALAFPSSNEEMLEVSRTLAGRYRLTGVLGSGSSGTVYEAVDQAGDARPVAVKFLKHLDASAVYQLKSEFRALSNHRHRNLVALHELVVEPDRACFFTMERVEGVPFTNFVREGPTAGRAERLRTALAELVLGLASLHAAGHVHRDLKPSNVLVESNGRVVVLDFGLVLTGERSSALEHRRGFQGTPAYAAPEQVDGERVTPSSDWYAVGVMLYEVLAGHLPFPGSEPLKRKAATLPEPPLPPEDRAGPLGELATLCLQLLAIDPADRATGMDVAALLGMDLPPELASPAQQMVGRDRELTELDRLLARAAAGSCEACLVLGDSGMGKTVLVEEFLRRARTRGAARVLVGRCQVQESVPYKAFDALMDGLTTLLRSIPQAELASVVPDDLGFLVQLFPILRRVPHQFRAAPRRTDLGGRRARERGFTALRTLLARLAATSPLVLFVDDLQWCDADSADLLRWLLRDPGPSGFFFVAAVRAGGDEEGRTARDALFPAGSEQLRVTELELRPLDRAAVARMAQRADGEHAYLTAAELMAKTGGHPFFAAELLRFAGASVTARLSLDEAISARAAELSPAARQGLSLLCLAGRSIPRSFLVHAVADFDHGALRELCVSRFARETIVHGDVQVAPYHDRIRVVVAREARGTELLAALSRLESHHGELGDDYVDFVADAHAAEGRGAHAVAVLERAARRATDALAFHRAASLYERARRLAAEPVERSRLAAAEGDASAVAGRAVHAAECYEEAAPNLPAADSFELRRKAMTQYFVGGEPERAVGLLRTLCEEVGIELHAADSGPRARLEATFAALPRMPRLRSHSCATEVEERRLRLFWSACAPLALVDQKLSGVLMARALKLSARVGDALTYAHVSALYAAGIQATVGSSLPWAERVFLRSDGLALSHGSPVDLECVRVIRAGANLMVGNFQGALDGALPIATAAGPTTELGSVLRTLARTTSIPALFWTGRLSTLAQVAESWADDTPTVAVGPSVDASRFADALVHLRNDDVTRAVSELDHAGMSDPWWFGWFALCQGDPERAIVSYLSRRHALFRGSAVFAGQRSMWYFVLGVLWAELAARGLDRGRGLGELRKCALVLQVPGFTWRAPFAEQLRATLAWLEGDARKASKLLRRAERGYSAMGMRLFAASVQVRLAALEPDSKHLENQALAVFAEEQIVRPERWIRMLVPGLDRE